MAAVTYTAGSEKNMTLTHDAIEKVWVSPSTMDSNDTVVLPLITGRTLYLKSCWDATSQDAVTFTLSTATVTIDAIGGTTDHVYVLDYGYY